MQIFLLKKLKTTNSKILLICKKHDFRTFRVDAQKLNSKFLRNLVLNNLETSLMSNIIVGYSFDIKKNILRVWSMIGHYTCATAGRFFKKCQKICQKMAKNRSWVILSETKCCSVLVQLQKKMSEMNFICMNFIRLWGLPAGMVSGRNNGLDRCYMEFGVRAKKKFHT